MLAKRLFGNHGNSWRVSPRIDRFYKNDMGLKGYGSHRPSGIAVLDSAHRHRFSKIEHYLAFNHSVESLLERGNSANHLLISRDIFTDFRPKLNDFIEKYGIERCGPQLLGKLGILNSAHQRYFAKIEH